LFVIEVVDDNNDEGLSPLEGEPTISIHALTGIQPRAARTIMIVVVINGTRLLALLDSGPTHNFIHDHGAITTPLTKMLRKGGFRWCPEVEGAFCAV
jgi:hypothetical protein